MIVVLFGLPWSSGAAVFLTVDEALELVFPECAIARSTHYLTEAERTGAAELAGAEISSGLVYRYEATCDGSPGGRAYFDTHRVRTLPETLMVALDAEGQVRRVEVLNFREPTDYLPGERWYRQFDGQRLRAGLRLKSAIRPVAGATLTVRATTEAVRRVLALDRVVQAREGAPE